MEFLKYFTEFIKEQLIFFCVLEQCIYGIYFSKLRVVKHHSKFFFKYVCPFST